MKRNNKKGFTIVELVIVIAVIAILSAVLIPTFGSVIDNANAAAELQEARSAYQEFLSDPDRLTALGDTKLYVVVDDSATDKVYYGEGTDGFGVMTGEDFEPETGAVVIDMDAKVVACPLTSSHSTETECDLCGEKATADSGTN